MRDGDIVEQGKHQELLARGGFYAELYNSQFERAEEPEAIVMNGRTNGKQTVAVGVPGD